METVTLTLSYAGQNADLELPVNVPMFLLAPILLERLAWTGAALTEETTIGARSLSRGIIVRPSETLGEAGIVDGEMLELVPVSPTRSAPKLPPTTSTSAVLQCFDSNESYPVRGRANLIGRSSQMDIDVSKLPKNEAVSRKHANIVKRRDGYWIKDERSTNGTIVDGHMLRPGGSARIREGTQIQLGEDGPILLFRFVETTN